MIISTLKERNESEKRVAITPDVAKKLTNEGHEVLIEQNAGLNSFFFDDMYKESGAKIVSKEDILKKSDILLSVDIPEESIISGL